MNWKGKVVQPKFVYDFTTAIPAIDSKWSSARFSDAAGNKSSMYFAPASQDKSKFELPPVPPAGIFDIRFASQSFVANIDGTANVAELVNGQMDAGYHQVIWNAANLSSGVYFYELKTEKFRSVKKLILMK